MWIFTDSGEMRNLKYSRALVVREAASERTETHGDGAGIRVSTWRHIPPDGFVLLSLGTSATKIVLAHRGTGAECENVLQRLRVALAHQAPVFDVRVESPAL
jgi:hypothetical protein